jgi:hypothetical protein
MPQSAVPVSLAQSLCPHNNSTRKLFFYNTVVLELMKIDVESAEVHAFTGGKRLLFGPDAPTIA